MSNLNTTRVALALGVAALTGLATTARADCDANGAVITAGTSCYHLKGSDTLFDIMRTSIVNARAAGIPGASDIFYEGTGSGNAENQMKQVTGTNLGVQSIGPMSRNMRPATIDPLATVPGAITGTFSQRVAGGTQGGHAAWAPTCQNVVGLDAAVFVTRATGTGNGLNDIALGVQNNAFAAPATFKQAVPNDKNLATDFTDGTAFNNPASTRNYNNLWSIVLSGVDGSGSLKACSDPRRVKALLDLSTAIGVPTLDHVYRRDDNSGTTDTIKDRIMVVPAATTAASPSIDPRYPFTGGRFCNGQSIGNINGATAQTGVCSVTRSNTTCKVDGDCPIVSGTTHEVCQFNLNNQDFDPIRRPCPATAANLAPTTCTDMTTGRLCQASDNNPNCSQGLIVALTDTDPGSSDITTSIANRIKNGAGAVIGYAAREAASGLNFQTKSIKINGTKGSDANVRNSAYMLARRLFLQNSQAPGNTAGDVPNDLASGINITGGGAPQLSAESAMFSYVSSRPATDPVVQQYNFITCAPTPGDDPCSLSNNLCADPASATAPPYSAAFPNGSFGATSGTGGTKSIDSQGNTWTGTTLAATTCSTPAAGALNSCITDGSTCVTGTPCPVANNRPANAACSQNSDCAAGLTCKDALGLGAPGALYSLVCAP